MVCSQNCAFFQRRQSWVRRVGLRTVCIYAYALLQTSGVGRLVSSNLGNFFLECDDCLRPLLTRGSTGRGVGPRGARAWPAAAAVKSDEYNPSRRAACTRRLLILIVFSIVSWAVIALKLRQFRSVESQTS